MFCSIPQAKNHRKKYQCSRCAFEDAGPWPIRRRCPGEPLLGDRIQQFLTRFGITKRQWEYWTGKPCNCSDRRDKLNRAHRAFKRWLSEFRKRFREPRE